MFNREPLLRSLDSECLGEVGSSAVIVGGHKMGKSHLLEYIYTRAQQSPGALFCRLDIDMIRAAAPKVSDHSFLRVFLLQLLQQIDGTLAQQKADRERWGHELPAAEAKAATLAALEPDPAILALHQKQLDLVTGYRQKVLEFDELSAAADSLRKLVAPGKIVKVDELAEVFIQLRGWRKRIVLLIDDYDLVVAEDGLSDRLFSFLRHANSERTMITLVTASARLMDLVLDTKSSDRKSLFNHFQTRPLIPFKGTEPERFLDWLGRADGGDAIVLNDEERRYLISVGGGGPHLLHLARRRFIDQNRPAESSRRQFEKDSGLVDECYVVFHRIWNGASAEEQLLLKAVADGAEVPTGSADRLEAEGYLVAEGAHLVPFSTLFVDFIKKKGKAPGGFVKSHTPAVAIAAEDAPIACDVKTPYEVFSSALLFATPDSADVAVFTVNNRTGVNQRLQLSCEFVPYSAPNVLVEDFPPGERRVTLPVDLKDEARDLLNPVWTSVKYSVTLNPGAREEVLITKSRRVRLLPKDYFLFARYDPAQKLLNDFSWLIAAWVNRQDPALEKVREEAMRIHPRLGHVLQKGQDARQFGREKAAALFSALKTSSGGDYFDSAFVSHSGENDYMQRVKTPGETLRTRNGNCVDGSVLFASLLALCGLEPGVLFIPKHALVAWKVPMSHPVEWEYLDTTLLKGGDFGDAVAAASRRVTEATAIQASGGIIKDPQAFAILVDVNATARDRGIVPI